MAELVIHSGLKLNGSLPVSAGEPLLSLDSTTGVVGQENSVGGNPFADNEVLLNNATDSSKEARFSLEQLTTGTSRVYTLPDLDGTIAVGDFWSTSGDVNLTGDVNVNTDNNLYIYNNTGFGGRTGYVEFRGNGQYLETRLNATDYSNLTIADSGASLKSYNSGGYSLLSVNNTNGILVNSSVATFGGIKYNADYSANYTTRSLVDKAYVDSVAGGGDYWPLGGSADLTATVGINDPTGSMFILFGQLGQNLGGIGMYGDYIETRAGSYALYQDGASSPLSSNISLDNGDITFTAGDDIILQTNLADVVITTPQGSAKYTADYSAYYTNRSLVDKEYVDSVAGGGSSSLTIEDVSTTTYNFVEADLGKVKHFTNAAGCTATVPVGLTSGWNCTVYRGSGAGTLTIASSGTLESAAATLDTEKTAATVFHRGTNIHVAVGALGSSGGGGGGITNGAAANELMKSDGINAVSSGIESTTAGSMNLGLAATAGTSRIIQAAGSGADIDIWVISKGNGDIVLDNTGTGNIGIRGVDSTSAFTVQGASGLAKAICVEDNTGTDLFVVNNDGRVYGTALHNNANAITGTTNQYIASGTYTPTLTNQANTGSLTAFVSQYKRVGNVVTVSGRITLTPTAVDTLSSVSLTLPIASNFTAAEQCAGTANRIINNVSQSDIHGTIEASSSLDEAVIYFPSRGTNTAMTMTYEFTYLIA